ncbi:type IVB secretion system protein IcmH/DotU [Hahella ganghwensis]|uniref:type IVB secretion system protein IcmH/DotU n=1 Tax=Hahella ganghwensis TaxID=286420 RepID=UPI0003703F54|nr:type IVB secretion system protein IcmH/DotU [Hahella ganghwensis]
MSNDSDKTFFGGRPGGGDDRTVIVPIPGGRPQPQSRPAPAQPQQAAPSPMSMPQGGGQAMDIDQGLNPLIASATELVALLGEIRQTVQVQNASQLRSQVVTAIKGFEKKAQAKGVAADITLSARYILCAALDEAVLNTPWGAEVGWARASLLSTFHNETFGGEKVFLILDRVQAAPAKYIDLIELIYVCLSLGFEGKYKLDPRGRDHLETIRDNLSRMIQMQRGEFERELSPRWMGSSQQKKRILEFIPIWVIASVVAALLLVSYSGFRYWLETVTDPQEQQLLDFAEKYKE